MLSRKGRGPADASRQHSWRTFVGSNWGEGHFCHFPSSGVMQYGKAKIVVFLFSVYFLVTMEYEFTFFLRVGKDYMKLLVLINIDHKLTEMRLLVKYGSNCLLKCQS